MGSEPPHAGSGDQGPILIWAPKLFLTSTFTPVHELMAASTKRDEVFCRIVSELASLLEVMNLKFCSASAILASPSVTTQHSQAQICV